MRSFTAKGHFWLPSAPDHKVSGWIEFQRDGGGTLHLIGQLISPFGDPMDRNAVPRIVGEGGTGAFTLDNCFQTRWQISSAGPGEQVYRAGLIFHGGHYYEEGEEPTFDRLAMDLRHLFAWTGRDNLTEDSLHGKHGEGSGWQVSVVTLPQLKTEVEPGVTLSVHHGVGITGNREGRTITQNETIQFSLDAPRVLPEITIYATLTQDLLSIVTNRIAEFDAFKISSPEFVGRNRGGGTSRDFLDLHVEWIAKERSDKTVTPADMAVPFDAIGGIDGVATWLRTAKRWRPLLARVMATRYSKMYADDRFFNTAAALEGLHRHLTGKETSFATRLSELAARAGDPFLRLVPGVDTWVRRVKVERNDHAHQLGNAAHTTGALRYYLADSAYWLFVMCLFRECRYPSTVFDAIEDCSEFVWLRDRLKEL